MGVDDGVHVLRMDARLPPYLTEAQERLSRYDAVLLRVGNLRVKGQEIPSADVGVFLVTKPVGGVGGKGQVQECIDGNIKSYPTWEFPDKTRLTGELTIKILSEKTGCSMA